MVKLPLFPGYEGLYTVAPIVGYSHPILYIMFQILCWHQYLVYVKWIHPGYKWVALSED